MRGEAFTVALMGLVIGLTAGCATAPATQEAKDELVRRAAAALTAWDQAVPGIERFAKGNLGYVFFPEITKGGAGVGAAYGRGVVYARGQHVGYADLSLGSLGPQLGGQTYQELIVFADEATFAQCLDTCVYDRRGCFGRRRIREARPAATARVGVQREL